MPVVKNDLLETSQRVDVLYNVLKDLVEKNRILEERTDLLETNLKSLSDTVYETDDYIP